MAIQSRIRKIQQVGFEYDFARDGDSDGTLFIPSPVILSNNMVIMGVVWATRILPTFNTGIGNITIHLSDGTNIISEDTPAAAMLAGSSNFASGFTTNSIMSIDSGTTIGFSMVGLTLVDITGGAFEAIISIAQLDEITA